MARGPFAEKSRNGKERRRIQGDEERRLWERESICDCNFEKGAGQRERDQRDMAQNSKRDLHLPVIALILAACVAATVAIDPEEPEWNLASGRGNALGT